MQTKVVTTNFKATQSQKTVAPSNDWPFGCEYEYTVIRPGRLSQHLLSSCFLCYAVKTVMLAIFLGHVSVSHKYFNCPKLESLHSR